LIKDSTMRMVRLLLAGLFVLGSTANSWAQAPDDAYPVKPIRFVVPYPPGGPLDQVARLLAEPMRVSLGQAVVVENRPGAGGNLGADLIAKSAPDGYTIVMGAVATHAINPALFKRMPYDANKDFSAITRVASVPNVLIMNPETANRLGIGNVRDLIGFAKRNPGKLNFASGGNGSAGHLAGELFKQLAGVSMVHIPYPGAAPAQLGLIAGQTDLMFDNLASAATRIRSGQLRAFAVTTAERSNFFPDLPTIAQSGLKGFDINTWFGVFAAGNTPVSIQTKLHSEIARALAEPAIKERMQRMGIVPAPMSPEAFTTFVRSEQRKYALVVKQSGAQVD
jgi:tripartite-type tricarboxylate transporter receptor subunit TctC